MQHSYRTKLQKLLDNQGLQAGCRMGSMLLALALLLLATPGAWAAGSPGGIEGSYSSNKPIQIQANKAVFDREQGTGTYIGSVKVDQGRLHLRGDKLVIKRGQGTDSHFIGIMTGDPATLVQEAEKPGQKPMHSHAEKITFNSGTRKLHLEGNAHVKQGNNTMSGKTVVYNLRTRQVTASRSKNRQVHITLYPNNPPSGLTNPENGKDTRQ